MDNSIFDEMVRSWGSPIVPRQQVGKFSGGVLNSRTMANLDCLGTGPKSKFRVGSKVVYRTKELAEWLAKRSSVNLALQKPGRGLLLQPPFSFLPLFQVLRT